MPCYPFHMKREPNPAAKIVEEYSMVVNDDGTKVLTSKMTMTDPDFYTQTITAEKKWQLQPGVRLLPSSSPAGIAVSGRQNV